MVWLSKKVDCFVPQVFFLPRLFYLVSRHEFLTVNLIPNFLCRFCFRISANGTRGKERGVKEEVGRGLKSTFFITPCCILTMSSCFNLFIFCLVLQITISAVFCEGTCGIWILLHGMNHGLRTPNEGIHQRNLKI